MVRRLLLLTSVLIGLAHAAGCKGVGTVCDQSGSTAQCGDGKICTFTRDPGTFDPNADPPPPLSVCLRQCNESTDCGEGELCRFVYCSTKKSCQTGAIQDPPPNVCGFGGSGGAGGMAGMDGTGGTGGSSRNCDSEATAFIKTIDPSSAFALTNLVEEDTTNLPETWGRYSIQLDIDAGLVDQLLQVGFNATASNFEPSGVLYDNIVVDPGAQYTQDFESLDQASTTALSGDGWVVFGNVFEADGTTSLYGYGPFEAPNSAAEGVPDAFSAVASGEGGDEQGEQQLSIFSDYQNADQGMGRRIEANTFQERVITAADVDTTIVFSFDAKRGDINAGCPDNGQGGAGGNGGAGGIAGAGGV